MAHSLKLCTISVTCTKIKCLKIVKMYIYIKYNIVRLLSCRKKDNLQPHVEPGDIFYLCYSIVQRAGDNTDILPLILQKNKMFVTQRNIMSNTNTVYNLASQMSICVAK